MLKAGALYFAIVVAFFIAVISASLIMLAAHYRSTYLKEVRYTRLLNNLDAGVLYLLTDHDETNFSREMDLFSDGADRITVERKKWGIYELDQVKAYVDVDTLSRVFLTGIDTQKDLEVLYLSDEDRPLSVTGDTRITGNASVPKSGMKKAYAEGKSYTGGDEVLYGTAGNSARTLKGLSSHLIKELEQELDGEKSKKFTPFEGNNLRVSFKDSARVFRVIPNASISSSLNGHILLFSDSTLTLSAEAKLNHVQVYARTVIIEEGFEGNCQIFARDSIIIKNKVKLNYPSVLGIIRGTEKAGQPKITTGSDFKLNGILFSHEQKETPLQTLISIGKNSKITGEIYATGLVKLERGVVVAGKISCNRFLLQTPTTLYENFLIDVTFNRKARSKYYLSSDLFEGKKGEKKLLQWLN